MASRWKQTLGGLALLAGVGAVVLWATGAFRSGSRIGPGREPAPRGEPPPQRTARAARQDVEVFEDAVGTVRSRSVVAISAQVSAQVLDVALRPGAPVKVGTPLVVLDDRDLVARKAQAQQAVEGAVAAGQRATQAKAQAEARLHQATLRHQRMQSLVQSRTVTPELAEAAEADWLSAKASVADGEAAVAAADAQRLAAAQVVASAEVALGHAKIASPVAGVVSERSVEPGDLAWPGRTLLVVLDPDALRLEARVREALIATVAKDQRYVVTVPGAGVTTEGVVAELVPSADPSSRTFTVRLDLRAAPGVHPGMFGRMRLRVGTRATVTAPREAIVRVGQLETVVVRDGDRWIRRIVTTGGETADGAVEVLSGLAGGETLGLPAAEPTR